MKLRLLQLVSAVKIQRLFRRFRMKKRKASVRKYDTRLIIKIQSHIRRHLQSKPNLILAEYKKASIQNNYLKTLKLHKGILQQQALKLRLSHEYALRRKQASEYTLQQIKVFEEGWLKHESELKVYNLTQAKLNEWEQRESKGQVFWQHLKTGEQSVKNPAEQFYKKNRKEMRKRAEEKFQERVLKRVEEDLANWQKRFDDQCAEIEGDIKRQTYFNLIHIFK